MEDPRAFAQKMREENPGLDPHVLPHLDPVPPSADIIENKKEDNQADVKIDMNEENDVTEKTTDSNKENEKEEVEEGTENKKPLLEDDSVKIDMKLGDEENDTPTLPLPDKKKKNSLDDEETKEEKLPVYLFPLTRINNAWSDSSSIFQFFLTSTCIIFQTVGWFTCVGGIPFISLAMLIIGSIYVDNCKIEPNIPIYLIVSGVIGTIQHVITIWTRYVPKTSQGRLKQYRRYCTSINGLFHLFLMIWFILGCIWVYQVHSEVDFSDPDKAEYCHKTLYYFAFWILNLSFILLGLLVVLSLCFLLCIIATPKD